MKKQVKPGKASARTAPDDLYVRKTIQIFPGFKGSKRIDVDAGISEEIKHTMIRESLVEEIGRTIDWDNFKRINTWKGDTNKTAKVIGSSDLETFVDDRGFITSYMVISDRVMDRLGVDVLLGKMDINDEGIGIEDGKVVVYHGKERDKKFNEWFGSDERNNYNERS